MGFITRQAPIGHLPHVIQTRQEEEDIPAEDEVVLEFDTTPLDMISGAGNRWLVGDISNSSGVDAQSSALAFVPKKPRQHVKFDSPLGRNDIWNEHHIRGPPPGRDYSPVPEAEALPGGPVLDDLRAQGGPGEGRMVEVRGIMARSADASESEGEGEGERAVVPGAGRGEDGSSEGEMEIRSESGEEGRGGEREEEKLIGSRGLVVQKEPKMQELLDAEGEPTGIEIEDQEEEPDFEELLRMLAAFPPHPDDPARLVVRDPTPGGPHIWDPLAPLARRPEGAAEEVDWDAMINARTRGAVRTAGVQRGGKREGTGGAGAGGGAAARRKVARV
ncbi:hypothetical protein T484DRAFT_1930781 [Baffinella frigidus]|nr:hypothetical protein T484DRAFT_1930781 [Cryptophyta sp. CCMP2293]